MIFHTCKNTASCKNNVAQYFHQRRLNTEFGEALQDYWKKASSHWSAQIHALNHQLHLSHPRQNKVFSRTYLCSLHLLRPFLYKEIKDSQNLEGVWTDISAPWESFLEWNQDKFTKKIHARRNCSFSASCMFYSSVKQVTPMALQERKGLDFVLQTNKGSKQSCSWVQTC